MSWLEDLNKKRVYNYRSKTDPEEIISGTKENLSTIFMTPPTCESGDKVRLDNLIESEEAYDEYEYAGFEPIRMGGMTKVTFEKNGRKAVRIDLGNGKTVVRSMTRENLMKGQGIRITGKKRDNKGELTKKLTFEIDSSLTKGCQEASTKETAKRVNNQMNSLKNYTEAANVGRKK